MDDATLFERYRELQQYVGWSEDDARRMKDAIPLVKGQFAPLIDDFYNEIEAHEATRSVITGGEMQIERLKGTLRGWLADLFAGPYDAAYVSRRWKVGLRHVEIGLHQVYTNVALSRLRTGLTRVVQEGWTGDPEELRRTVRALNKLLDLDLAMIEDAYQAAIGDRLQRTERLATLGQVAGGVAHELRNPLNVVKTSVYYLLHARNPAREKVEEHLRRIERQVGLADSVITSLSNFARMPTPNLQPTSIESVLRESLDLNAPGEGIEVDWDVPPDLPPVLSDADQLQIVFGNLVRNARDAMPEGGRLLIGARLLGENVEVDVTDTGTGIPAEDLKRILEPLYSTKARGLGLGLSIVRSIVERCRGEVRVASVAGEGSTFTVRLPAETPNHGATP